MPRIQPEKPQSGISRDLNLDEVHSLLNEIMALGHFFVGPGLNVDLVCAAAEEVSWEIFQGTLLDPAHTRERRSFISWSLYQGNRLGRSGEPLLSLKLDGSIRRIHVVRGIVCHAWEGYDAGENVFMTRETRKWVRELIGTVDLNQFGDLISLQAELSCLLFRAIVGTSRLPLTSREAPLPSFTFGSLTYVRRPVLLDQNVAGIPLRSYSDLIEHALTPELAWIEKTKILEIMLRAVPLDQLAHATDLWCIRWESLGHTSADLLALLRNVFNEIALSPYTDFVDKVLAFIDLLCAKGTILASDQASFLSHLLRIQGRHLTAYDLITFHHRGANYPDALLIDAVLQALLRILDREPGLWNSDPRDTDQVRKEKRLGRRGLRQGWLHWHVYQGLPVPDAPTSEGENLRILPDPFTRVPDEQIQQTRKRKKKLYQGESLASHLTEQSQAVLGESMEDLRDPVELRELGMAVFLDRPLSVGKAAVEPDSTLLLSYEAFSRSLAEQRFQFLNENLQLLSRDMLNSLFPLNQGDVAVPGIPASSLRPSAESSVVSLQDCVKVAGDFVIMRNTRTSLASFFDQYDWREAAKRMGPELFTTSEIILVLRGAAPAEFPADTLTIFDSLYRPRMLLAVETSQGYRRLGSQEFPLAGLRALRAWKEIPQGGLREVDVQAEPLLLPPRKPY